jgi:hypothetical protein
MQTSCKGLGEAIEGKASQSELRRPGRLVASIAPETLSRVMRVIPPLLVEPKTYADSLDWAQESAVS